MSTVTGPGVPAGQMFLQGGLTSVFAGTGVTEAATSIVDGADMIQNKVSEVSNQLKSQVTGTATSLASAAGSIAGGAVGTVSNVLGDATQIMDLAKQSLNNVITYAQEQLTAKVMTLMTPPVKEMASYMAAYISAYTKEVGKEAIENVVTASEDRAKKEQEKNEENSKTTVLESITKKTTDITKKVNDFTKGLTDDFQQLQQFMLAGPAWMSEKIEEKENEAKKVVYDQVIKQVDDLIEKRNAWAKGEGEKQASKQLEKLKGDATKNQKNIVDKAAKAVAKAKTAVTTAVQDALLKVFALIGV